MGPIQWPRVIGTGTTSPVSLWLPPCWASHPLCTIAATTTRSDSNSGGSRDPVVACSDTDPSGVRCPSVPPSAHGTWFLTLYFSCLCCHSGAALVPLMPVALQPGLERGESFGLLPSSPPLQGNGTWLPPAPGRWESPWLLPCVLPRSPHSVHSRLLLPRSCPAWGDVCYLPVHSPASPTSPSPIVAGSQTDMNTCM